MKKLLLLLFIPLCLSACEKDDEPFIQIKGIESLIFQAIQNYRITQGEDGPFVHQYLMVGEAQEYSAKMSTGVQEVNTDGLTEHWDDLLEKYNFYNRGALVMKTLASTADDIFQELLQQEGASEVLLADVSQCGVGTATDEDGFNYITILLAKAD